ncbi:MAG TPA: ROK family transcriptional regulator [Kineosporiaceae bacterium]|nr:ROK family transcriptional regulator [Kineosporiaceae bacterium]
MRQVGTNLPKVGSYNRAVVLDLIQLADDGISRVEIAQHTGLTPQTVSGIVRRLLDEGIAVEDGSTRTTGLGKPRTTLRINPQAGSALGLQLGPSALGCVLVDLLGHPIASEHRPLDPAADPRAVLTSMAGLVDEVLTTAGMPRDRVLGLGVVAPGPIDQELGMVISPPQLAHWVRIPIKQALERLTRLPVTLDNDATAAAIGERRAGAGRGVANFAYFYLGQGIGGGLVLGHHVYRGGSLNAAEFGHMTVVPGGPACYCGNHGCLERLIGPVGLTADVRARLAGGAGAGSALARAHEQDPASVDYAALCTAAAAGDPFAVEVVDEAAELLAHVVVNVVNVVDVDLVVLGGPAVLDIEEQLRVAVTRAVHTRAIARAVRPVRVEISPLGTDAALLGAASLVLHAMYAPQVSALLSE